MKSIDEHTYKKYFSQRRDASRWSEKNRSLFNKLKEQGIMTKYGISSFRCAQSDKVVNKEEVGAINISILKEVLRDNKDAYDIFESTAPSRQKQLAGSYCEAKSAKTREKRKAKIIEAIKGNNKGMLYLHAGRISRQVKRSTPIASKAYIAT